MAVMDKANTNTTALNHSAARNRAALCFVLPDVPGGAVVPEWIELIPAPGADGAVRGRDGRQWRFDAARVATAMDIPLPLDINHASELIAPAGGEAPAAGWIEQLEARAGALWGRVAWTERGQQLVRNREYRYISPAFGHADGEVQRLTSAALVNQPNFDLALNSAETQETPPMKALLKLLGLAESATEEQAVAALNALTAQHEVALNSARSAAADPAKYAPRQELEVALNRATTAEAELQTLKGAQHESEITAAIDAATAAGKVIPATRDYYIAMCRAEGGLAAFRELEKVMPVIVAPERVAAAAAAAAAAGGDGLTAEERAVCSATGVSAEQYLAARGAQV